MFCRNCGKKLPDHAMFCPECGQPVERLDGSPKEETAGGNAPSDPERKGKKRIWAAIVLLILAAAAAVTALVIYPRWSTKKQAEQAEEQLQAGDYESVILFFEEAVKKNPKELAYYPKLAEAYAKTDDREKAIEILEQGMEVYQTLEEEEKEEVLPIENEMTEKLADLLTEQASSVESAEEAKTYRDKAESLKPENEETKQKVEEAVGKIEEIVQQKEQEEARRQITEEVLRKLLENTAGTNIVFMICDDFDGNQALEAFALVGSVHQDEYESVYEGTLWYVNGTEAGCIREHGFYWLDSENVLDFEEKKYFEIFEYYTTGNLAYVWGVNADQAYEETSVSGKCSSLRQTSEKSRELYVTEDTYDAEYDAEMDMYVGHTWKRYYLYWDGEFHEYGGTLMTEEELLVFDGAQAALDLIRSEGREISTILYRANGIININYSYGEGLVVYGNMTLRCDGNTVTVEPIRGDDVTYLEDTSYGGTYAPAFLEDIATYPDSTSFRNGIGKLEVNQFLSTFTNTSRPVKEYTSDNPDWGGLLWFAYNFLESDGGNEHVENTEGMDYATYVPADSVNRILRKYFNIEAPKESFSESLKYNAEKDAYLFRDLGIGLAGMDLILADEIKDLGEDTYEVAFTNVCVNEEAYSESTGEYVYNNRPYKDWNIYYTYSMDDVANDIFCEVKAHGQAKIQRIDGRYVLLELKMDAK